MMNRDSNGAYKVKYKGQLPLPLIKVWQHDGQTERTTWEKELPTLKKNYNKQEIEYILRSLLLGHTIRTTNFSSLKKELKY